MSLRFVALHSLGKCRPFGTQKNVYQCLTQGLRLGLCRSIALTGLFSVSASYLLECLRVLTEMSASYLLECLRVLTEMSASYLLECLRVFAEMSTSYLLQCLRVLTFVSART